MYVTVLLTLEILLIEISWYKSKSITNTVLIAILNCQNICSFLTGPLDFVFQSSMTALATQVLLVFFFNNRFVCGLSVDLLYEFSEIARNT